jgi:hypothetical protein
LYNGLKKLGMILSCQISVLSEGFSVIQY